MMGMHAADQVIGVILDPFASLMNHSCDPNAFVFCEGTQLRVRTLRPIAAGDEIMISYTNGSYDYKFRQKRLKSKYFFACECKSPPNLLSLS
jgi:SET domain-containing protein